MGQQSAFGGVAVIMLIGVFILYRQELKSAGGQTPAALSVRERELNLRERELNLRGRELDLVKAHSSKTAMPAPSPPLKPFETAQPNINLNDVSSKAKVGGSRDDSTRGAVSEHGWNAGRAAIQELTSKDTGNTDGSVKWATMAEVHRRVACCPCLWRSKRLPFTIHEGP